MQVHKGWKDRHGDAFQLGWRWQGQQAQSEASQETLHRQEQGVAQNKLSGVLAGSAFAGAIRSRRGCHTSTEVLLGMEQLRCGQRRASGAKTVE